MKDVVSEADIAIVIDTTGSMELYIVEARRIAEERVKEAASKADLDIRVAVVEYRDHPPNEDSFVTWIHPFTSVDNLTLILREIRARGGGDIEEAVLDGLVAAASLDWRPHADRMCILIGDEAPKDPCECGLTSGGVAELLGFNRIHLHAISIANRPNTSAAFGVLAEATGGDIVVIDRKEGLVDALAAGLDRTSSVVLAGRSYIMAAASMKDEGIEPSPERIAERLGWTPSIVKEVERYLEYRGLSNPIWAAG